MQKNSDGGKIWKMFIFQMKIDKGKNSNSLLRDNRFGLINKKFKYFNYNILNIKLKYYFIYFLIKHKNIKT